MSRKSKPHKERPPRKCTSEAQKRAIRKNYAVRATKTKTVNVQIKNYRDRNGGHPHVIVDNVDSNHVSVGFTHSPKKGKGHPNYALEINPLGESRKAYMRRQGTVASKNDYIEPRTGEMTEADFAKAKEYGEKAKRKYTENKHKKK